MRSNIMTGIDLKHNIWNIRPNGQKVGDKVTGVVNDFKVTGEIVEIIEIREFSMIVKVK